MLEKRGTRYATKIEYIEAMRLLEQLHRGKRRNVYLIDVRSRAEYEKYHLYGAILCNMNTIINGRFPYFDRYASYFLYCDQGIHSEIAANYLSDHGYQNVYFFGIAEKKMYES